MHPLLRSWRIWVLIVFLLFSAGLIVFKGVQLGIDFRGGTVLIFSFERPLTPSEMQSAVQIIEKRLNWTGLQNVIVRPWGAQYVIVEVPAVSPEEVERIKKTILTQGRLEAVVDGNVVLEGKDIVSVRYDYTITPLKEGVEWELPFVLSQEGKERFYRGVYGKCSVAGCEYVYMYIDRPANKIILIPKDVFEKAIKDGLPTRPDKEARGELNVYEFLRNSGAIWYVVDENFDVNVLRDVNTPYVILHPGLNYLVPALEAMGKKVDVVPVSPTRPWLWDATNLRSVVALTPDVTNVTDPARASNTLVIRGWARNREDALRRINELRIILESGALPAAVFLASEQSIPPTYGLNAFYTFLLALILSMIAVSLYIAVRYRHIKIAAPIALTVFSEILIVFGFAALVGWKIDVPSMVGMITATGTGVDDQIIITDEILHGEEEREEIKGILAKIKRAFFIVFASAFALVSSMVPVLLSGITTLVGFAITTIVGVFVGILITRPAFAEIMRYLFSKPRKG